MNRTGRRLTLLTLLILPILGLAIPAAGQAPAPAPAPAPAVAADKAAVAPDAVPAPRLEQSIYIPYKRLWQVFEKEGRGVFLPYEQFQELWKAAESARTRLPDAEPPVGALIAELSGQATVSKDVIRVVADVRIELLKEGWHRIPLRLGDAALTRAELNGQPARIVRDDDRGYALVVEKKGKQPEVARLTLEFAKSYTRAPGQNRVSFQIPQVPISRWDVRIPEPGVKVDIQPLLAATDAPAGDAAATETRLMAFVGAAPELGIEWTPKAEGAKGLKALTHVKVEQQVQIDEGVTRTRARLNYEISRTELSRLALEVPAGQKVVQVFDQNVREWSVTDDGTNQTITVQLFEPTKGTQALVVEMEKYSDDTRIEAPRVRALDVSRQQGTVVVRMGAGLRADVVTQEGVQQTDAKELPERLAAETWNFAYRYAALPYTLALNVEKVLPVINVDTVTTVRLQPENLLVDYGVRYDIQKAGVFQLRLAVPGGYEVLHVGGLSQDNLTPAVVDTHYLEEARDGVRPMVVSLSRKAEGRVGLRILLQRRLQEPDLLTPTGKAAVLAVALPRARMTGVERETGRLMVYGPESLRINPLKAAGLRPISHAEARKDLPEEPGTPERLILSYASAAEAAALELAAERRAPQITVAQLLVARIESGVVRYQATLVYDVLYSGVKSLRLDVPVARADKIRVLNPEIRHSVMEDAAVTNDLAAGYTAWKLESDTEFMGRRLIRLQWEEKTPELDIGQTIQIELPRLLPRRTDRAWGQIALAKAESIDIAPSARNRRGLLAIDPRQDLLPDVPVADAAQAFEYHDDWALTLDVTRYEPKEVKATSIERGLVRMVVTRSDVTSVQALYRIRSAHQRLTLALPADARFDTQPVRINGKPVTLEQGGRGEFFIPLVSQTPDQAFLLELRYVMAGAGLTLTPPSFPKEPAVQQVYLSVYLPAEQTFLGSRGPWNAEFSWTFRGFNALPYVNRSGEFLIGWVGEGLGQDLSGPNNFATDGRHLLFSTLRPEAGEAGALRITAMRDWVVRVGLIGVICAIGLLLLPAGFATRLKATGLGLVLVVLLAVFAPSFFRAAVNGGSVAAGLAVLTLWGLRFLIVTLPRSPVLAEQREARRLRALEREARIRQLTASPPPPPNPPAVPGAGTQEGARHE